MREVCAGATPLHIKQSSIHRTTALNTLKYIQGTYESIHFPPDDYVGYQFHCIYAIHHHMVVYDA